MTQGSCKQLHQNGSRNFILKDGKNFGEPGESGRHSHQCEQRAEASEAGVGLASAARRLHGRWRESSIPRCTE